MKIKLFITLSIILTVFKLGNGFYDRKLDGTSSNCHFKVNKLLNKYILRLNNDHLRLFYKLEGDVYDCNCSFKYIDSFNNYQIQPLINYLLKKNYFRFFKVSYTQ